MTARNDMSIRIEGITGGPDMPVDVWMTSELTYVDQGGRLEDVTAVAENCAGAIGRLIDLLVSKELLSATEVHYIARGYHTDKAVFLAGE